MTVTIKDLINFGNCSDIFEGQKISIKTAFTIEKIKESLNKELPFYQAKIKEIISEFGQFDEEGNLKYTEDGQGFLLKEDKIQDFYEQMSDLESIEIEIHCKKFNLEDIENANISMDLMKFLMPFIEN